ncbi:hypothetical protein GS533_024870 (plasmid) [Prescottella equi]|nr:hypothetical protein GS533_024870 [Prescottella equi]
MREDRDRGRDDTERQWQRALATAAQFPATVLVERAPVDDELDRVEESLTADPSRWARPGGASDERILHALLVLARTARRALSTSMFDAWPRPPPSTRPLSPAAYVSSGPKAGSPV